MHLQIVPLASSKPLEELSRRVKRRRTLSAELHQRIVQAPLPSLLKTSAVKLSAAETMTFSQLTGQQTHRLATKGLNFLCSDHELRRAEKELEVPIHIDSTEPLAFRLKDITGPLTLMLTALHRAGLLATNPYARSELTMQIQVDKGTEITKGLLKVINVLNGVHQKNILPIFYYMGDESYDTINALLKPLLTQLEEYALPPTLARCFSAVRKVVSADIKALQTLLGLSESSRSTFPCTHCLIPSEQLRSATGMWAECRMRNSLQHGVDNLGFQIERKGDLAFVRDYFNCKRPPPFIYGLPAFERNIIIGMPVLHISIGLATKLLKLVRSLASDKETFKQLLNSLNLSFYLYHGETLIGSQVHRLLGGEEPLYLKILDSLDLTTRDTYTRKGKVIVTQVKQHSRLRELFELFAKCYKLYTADRFLKAEEVESLATSCKSFGEKFTEYYRWESLTPKLHLLCVEIPRFARLHHTVGLYSEQAIESLHAETNQLLRDYAGMGKSARKHMLVFQALYRKHCPAIPVFDPPRRLCSVCDGPLAGNKDIHTACQLLRRRR